MPSPNFMYQNNINSTPELRLDLRSVDKDVVKKLRDHLLKEFNRRHPDKPKRLLEGEGRLVVSKNRRFKMTTSVGIAVDQVVSVLRNAYEALNKEFGR